MKIRNEVILVDENDSQIGISEKLEAHQAGKLHRAFSIFVFTSAGQLLVQKRAEAKYHCGGLWSNTCCGHPSPGEATGAAAHRRLQEEMGFDCPLEEIYEFTYEVKFDNGLSEREYNHVLVGRSDTAPRVNPAEVDDWKWVDPRALRDEMKVNPEAYTYWFRVSLAEILAKLRN